MMKNREELLKVYDTFYNKRVKDKYTKRTGLVIGICTYAWGAWSVLLTFDDKPSEQEWVSCNRLTPIENQEEEEGGVAD